MRRRIIAAWLLLAALAASFLGRADALELPPVTGHLAGRYRMPAIADFPALDWHAEIRVAEGDRRSVTFEAHGDGANLQLVAEVDASGQSGHWQLIAGELDAAKWFAVLAPQLGDWANGLAVSGRLLLRGEGEIVAGRGTGSVQLLWQAGAVRQAAQDWALEGVEFHGAFAVDSEARTAGSTTPFELTVATITTSRFGARNLRVRGLLDPALKVSVREAAVEVAGGNVTIDPFSLALRDPVLDLGLRMVRVGLQDIVALVPSGFSMARGRIDGDARVRWSEAEGLQVGTGRIELRDDEPAVVRLTATPGFLTSRVPARIALLPAWLGPLARWFSPVNPAYADMQALELGQADLKVQALTVRLTPETDDRGRTAHVSIKATPATPGAVKEVTFEVNVNGPLAAVLKLGMNRPFSLSAK